jgi:hypothetical protein
MKIFCIEDFKIQFDKLSSKKSYNPIEQDIKDYFFNKSVQELSSGIRLNASNLTPYIKKRINGKRGFRFYYLLIIKDENLYLMFVHPKTGSLGADNIDDKSKALLYKKILEAIKTSNFYEMKIDATTESLIFEKI